MASTQEDSMLAELSEEIDIALVKWMAEYKVPPLNITAVILARLTWLAKQTDCKEDFISLLQAPREILESEEEHKQVH
jgi:hypothetical protein